MEVDEIVSKLSEKHSHCFSVKQIRAWIHMIHEEAPNKPVFRKKKTDGKGTCIASTTTSNSPKHRIELRSQCMNNFKNGMICLIMTL